MGDEPWCARTARLAGPMLAAALMGAVGSVTSSAAPSGDGDGVIHKVERDGERYTDIAEHYYGRSHFGHHLRVFNGRGEPLARGMSIIIPTFGTIALKRGQSLQEFAEAHLSDAGRADYLAELHDLKGRDRTTPRAGTPLRVVQSLKHVVRPGETLRSIARIYYRDGARAGRARLVSLYNKLPPDMIALAVGTHLRIPLDEPEFNRDLVRARAKAPFSRRGGAEGESALPESAAESGGAPLTRRPQKRRASPFATEKATGVDKRSSASAARDLSGASRPDLSRAVDELERLLSEGLFDACQSHASAVFDAAAPGAAEERTEILRLRAVALIALGRVDESKSTFKLLLAIEPDYELDLYRTSPKVLDVFQAVAER